MSKTLEQIVLDAIEDAGADGLVNVELECGCHKNDLWPCESPSFHCELARVTDPPREWEDECDEWFVPLEAASKEREP